MALLRRQLKPTPIRISPKILTRWTSDLASGTTIKALGHVFDSVVRTTIWRSGSCYTQVLNCIRRSYKGACGILLETNPHTRVKLKLKRAQVKRRERRRGGGRRRSSSSTSVGAEVRSRDATCTLLCLSELLLQA